MSLTAADLAYMRNTVAQTLTDTAVVYRWTFATDSAGGDESTWAAVGTVSAFVPPGGKQAEVEIGGKVTMRQVFRVYVSHGSTVNATDRLVVGGNTYEVVSHDDGQTSQAVIRCDCVRVV